MSMKLTSKQKRFCEEYVIDLNGTQSAIRAGYSENSAYSIAEENLKKPEIEKYISGLQAEIRERNNIKADDVITDIVKIKEQCMQVKPIIIYDKAGNAKEIKSFKANAALKACELLGRYTGIFKEDNGQKNIMINISEEKVQEIINKAFSEVSKKFEIPKNKEEILGFCKDFGIET